MEHIVEIIGNIVSDGNAAFYKTYYDDEDFTHPKKIKEAIKNVQATDTITLLVNCYGGDVVQGHSILDMLRKTGAQLNCDIQGICASEAALLAFGCDTRKMSYNSMLMVHNVRGGNYGTQYAMESERDVLKKYDDMIAEYMANVSGKTTEEIYENYLHGKSDVYKNAQEALDENLINAIYNEPKTSNKVLANSLKDNSVRALQTMTDKEKQLFVHNQKAKFENFMSTLKNKATTNEGDQVLGTPDNEVIVKLQTTVTNLTSRVEEFHKEAEEAKTVIANLQNKLAENESNYAVKVVEFETKLQEAEKSKNVLLNQISAINKQKMEATIVADVKAVVSSIKVRAGIAYDHNVINKVTSAFINSHIINLKDDGNVEIRRVNENNNLIGNLADIVTEYAARNYSNLYQNTQGIGLNIPAEANTNKPLKGQTYQEVLANIHKNEKIVTNSREYYQAIYDAGFGDKIDTATKEYHNIGK